MPVLPPARAGVALLLLWAVAATAAPEFPPLSGRVVDRAGLVDAATERRLSALLEAHENATTNQVVVVTLSDLGGYAIEDYGYQLGRHWGIGQQGRDNGALLIVARDERRVRIEVGYGLEGQLTDAISANIIHSVILPRFRTGGFAEGIEAGVTAMIQALGGEYRMRERPRGSERRGEVPFWLMLVVFGVIGIANLSRRLRHGRVYGARHGYGGVHGGWGGGSRGGFGGGFGGGGGGFGGGGASGGW